MNEPLVNAEEQIVYQFQRLVSLSGWWTWAAIIVGTLCCLYGVARLYRRDTVELPWATGVSLLLLRLAVLISLVFFFLNLERRAQQRITRPSEVVVMVDTSTSMAMPADQNPQSPSRMEALTGLLSETPWLQSLSQRHRTVVYGFDDSAEIREIAAFDPETKATAPAQQTEDPEENVWTRVALVGASILCFGLVSFVVSGLAPLLRWRWATGMILVGSLCLVIGGSVLLSAWTVRTEHSVGQLLGVAEVSVPEEEGSGSAEDSDDALERLTPDKVNWKEELIADGTSSRIGDAIRTVLNRHDPSSLAGILLCSDGQSNAGIPLEDAAAYANREGVSIFPVGFGSPKPPVNVRIVDVDLPRRVYPGDKFAMSVVLQSSGFAGQEIDISILEGPDGESEPTDIIETRSVMLDQDGKLSAFQIDLDPPSIGKRRLKIQLDSPDQDQHPDDDQRHARYEVVDRKVRVLLVAGGPMREYRFVRNLLHRDRDVSIDVLLQTGQKGMSQESDGMLDDFPSTPEELFEYDAIIAFDPDWLALEAAQIQLLDRWLSETSGGLILVAGPVHLPLWSRLRGDIRVNTIKGFFPVNLAGRNRIIDPGRQGGTTPWPLRFTAEGQRSAFLSLGEEPIDSAAIWGDFGGVFDFVGVKDPKPGAKVYAHFSDPTTSIDGRFPIYLASHFYGSGRVFFQGSGEMWRLRALSDSYFDAYYIMLVRWATEGRLLRDSTRGVLLVDKPRAMVGDTISVRAVLTDAQYQPLQEPRVTAKLVSTSGHEQEVILRPLEGQPRPGTYGAQFVARTNGSYELQLLLGDALDEQMLRQQIQITAPKLELERPQRNDVQLRAMAASTGGTFASGSGSEPSESEGQRPMDTVTAIQPRPQSMVLPGTPDRDFHRRRNASLIWLIGGALAIEWLVRRLNRLA